MELNENDPFEAQVIRIVEMNRAKRSDYAGDNGPFFNFIRSAQQLGLTAGHSVEQLIAVKQARLEVLLPNFWKAATGPVNEPIADTILDRAVYSVIALCLWEGKWYEI